MEIDRYCNSCLGYYSYDIDETDRYESVVGVDQKILKKPEDKGLSMLTPLFGFISIMSDREVRYRPLLMFIWKREFSTQN